MAVRKEKKKTDKNHRIKTTTKEKKSILEDFTHLTNFKARSKISASERGHQDRRQFFSKPFPRFVTSLRDFISYHP